LILSDFKEFQRHKKTHTIRNIEKSNVVMITGRLHRLCRNKRKTERVSDCLRELFNAEESSAKSTTDTMDRKD
jgi:hypothetical protein